MLCATACRWLPFCLPFCVPTAPRAEWVVLLAAQLIDLCWALSIVLLSGLQWGGVCAGGRQDTEFRAVRRMASELARLGYMRRANQRRAKWKPCCGIKNITSCTVYGRASHPPVSECRVELLDSTSSGDSQDTESLGIPTVKAFCLLPENQPKCVRRILKVS